MIKNFLISLRYAVDGIRVAVITERHIRFDLFMAALVAIAAFILGMERSEIAIIVLVSALVIALEMINTALEKIMDFLHPDYDERVKIIKDVAAGAVLIAAIGSVVIGALLFLPYISVLFSE